MAGQPDHAAILAAVAELRDKLDEHIDQVRPLVDIAPELKGVAEVVKAAGVGRRALVGLSVLGAAIGMIAGSIVALKLALRHWLMG